MSGTRGGVARVVAMGIALALALLLLAAREATAGKYAVAQCGWYVGADASWADTTGGAKFRQDGWCVPPVGQDPFDGAHLKSLTRDGQSTVSGTRFARWRWEAPPGTGITQVRGTWWHALHDGMEQRIGVGNWNGGFDVFAAASSTDTAPREFVAGFNPPQPALEDRLLCARVESKSCSLGSTSWSALRALTITLQDDATPVPGPATGELMAGGWRRGAQRLEFSDSDVGGGIRFGETLLDGARIDLTEYPCAKAMIGGEWRGTQMRPCWTYQTGGSIIQTRNFSDGPHALTRCAVDFAGNPACLFPALVQIDNNPPAHPRNLALGGGDGWRRTNDFDLSWANPDQGSASPIGGALWRIEGPAGYDTGVKFAAGHNLGALNDRSVPRAGTFSFSIWLRDEAGNDAPSSAISLPLRLDDVPPGVAFDSETAGSGEPEQIRVQISDIHSGPVSGEIRYRRLDTQQWEELPVKFQPGASSDGAQLIGRLPERLVPGTYVFRAEAVDAAGNKASTARRADGTEMTVRKVAPAAPGPPLAAVKRAQPVRGKTRIFARLSWRGRAGTELTVPFRVGAMLTGRLLDANGAGLAGRTLRVVSRPSRGALERAWVDAVATGPHGGFRFRLDAGTSRRIAVAFPGEEQLDGASRRPLTLRVRGGIDFQATPHALHTGEKVRFHGRVRTFGAPLPRRGKLVAIQYYESAAKRWRPVLVTRTDHGGRFRAGYRFRYVSGSASIRLRAVALSEERWPYAPGASRPVTVRVSG